MAIAAWRWLDLMQVRKVIGRALHFLFFFFKLFFFIFHFFDYYVSICFIYLFFFISFLSVLEVDHEAYPVHVCPEASQLKGATGFKEGWKQKKCPRAVGKTWPGHF